MPSGAIHGHTAPISLDGNTTFTHNAAGENGGEKRQALHNRWMYPDQFELQ